MASPVTKALHLTLSKPQGARLIGFAQSPKGSSGLPVAAARSWQHRLEHWLSTSAVAENEHAERSALLLSMAQMLSTPLLGGADASAVLTKLRSCGQPGAGRSERIGRSGQLASRPFPRPSGWSAGRLRQKASRVPVRVSSGRFRPWIVASGLASSQPSSGVRAGPLDSRPGWPPGPSPFLGLQAHDPHLPPRAISTSRPRTTSRISRRRRAICFSQLGVEIAAVVGKHQLKAAGAGRWWPRWPS